MSVSIPLEEFTALDKGVRVSLVKDATVTSEANQDSIECFAVYNNRAFDATFFKSGKRRVKKKNKYQE